MSGVADWVAGVDGCPAGWLVVLRRRDDPANAFARLCSRFADILDLPEQPEFIAVDMPIGLPECSGVGGRQCDIEARAKLGQRQSSMFAVPSRDAVMQTEYRAACAVALATSDPPRKVAKQTFNLFARIREIDALMTPALQVRVVECHPELAFWALNGGVALELPKKVRSRPFAPGLDLRRELLSRAGYAPDFLTAQPFRASLAGPDDLLDACACAWSAVRIARGVGHSFPADPPHDARGLAMAIRA